MKHENKDYRAYHTNEKPGYLLEFNDIIPVILVPDLHARNDFFLSLLNYSLEGTKLLDRITNGTIRILCLGDGMHAESRAKDRWIHAYDAYVEGNIVNDYIYQEMAESLQLMMRVMRCKIAAPAHFHFLKGNHENILNEEGYGNHPFSKFALEGQLVRDFMLSYYGIELTMLYSSFEKLLPLFIIGSGFLASHAEPASYYTKMQLQCSGLDAEVCEGLTWTANNAVSGRAVKKMLRMYQQNFPHAVYFAGHRPVKNDVAYRADGKFIQIHNPSRTNVVYLERGSTFNPEKNILRIGDFHV